MEGYEGSNARALQKWEAVYPDGALRVALTDTFSTRRKFTHSLIVLKIMLTCITAAFFHDLRTHPELAKRWNGLRQDSGDPFEFIGVVVNLYNDLGIDPSTSEYERITRFRGTS